MKEYKIAVIAGDGIGPEVIAETKKVIEAINEVCPIKVSCDDYPYNADYYLETGGGTIPESAFKEWPEKYNGILLGAFGAGHVPAHYAESILLGLRRKLDLYANYRPVEILSSSVTPLKLENDVRFSVFRENTEGLYCGSGGLLKANTKDAVAVENSITTYKGVRRIILEAFEYAKRNNKSKVVMVDKHNVMKFEGSIWFETFKEISAEFPDIETQQMFVDRACMELIRKPEQFDVIVTSNMFGDIISDIGGQIQGGLGLAPSANYNPEYENFAGVFEPVHGSAPDIAGKQIANPIGAVLSFNLMMQRLGEGEVFEIIRDSVNKVIAENKVTPDLGGNCSTVEVGDLICQNIRKSKV